jgi:hypothetical protein
MFFLLEACSGNQENGIPAKRNSAAAHLREEVSELKSASDNAG